MKHTEFAGKLLLGAALFLPGCAWSKSQQPDAAHMFSGANSNSVGNTVSRSWKSMTTAMTPKPTVIAAPDPTSLGTPTPKLGPDLYVSAARQHEAQGQLHLAEEHYRKALSMNPHDATVQLSLARLLHREGKIEPSIEVYRNILAANPQHAVAHNDLGLCLARAGKIDEAVAELTLAVSQKPESKLYRNNLATVLAEMGRGEEALGHLQAAHGEAGGHYNLAVLLAQRGQGEIAATHYARARELDPSIAGGQQPRVAQLPTELRPAQPPVRNNNEFIVNEANAPAAPYRLPTQPVADTSNLRAEANPYTPTALPPVMVDDEG